MILREGFQFGYLSFSLRPPTRFFFVVLSFVIGSMSDIQYLHLVDW